jgi:hypothetical protein
MYVQNGETALHCHVWQTSLAIRILLVFQPKISPNKERLDSIGDAHIPKHQIIHFLCCNRKLDKSMRDMTCWCQACTQHRPQSLEPDETWGTHARTGESTVRCCWVKHPRLGIFKSTHVHTDTSTVMCCWEELSRPGMLKWQCESFVVQMPIYDVSAQGDLWAFRLPGLVQFYDVPCNRSIRQPITLSWLFLVIYQLNSLCTVLALVETTNPARNKADVPCNPSIQQPITLSWLSLVIYQLNSLYAVLALVETTSPAWNKDGSQKTSTSKSANQADSESFSCVLSWHWRALHHTHGRWPSMSSSYICCG